MEYVFRLKRKKTVATIESGEGGARRGEKRRQ